MSFSGTIDRTSVVSIATCQLQCSTTIITTIHMHKRFISLFIPFLILSALFSCRAEPRQLSSDALPEDPELSVKIGQMLKVGFRGLTPEESSHIIRDLEEYHLGAVVLFDYDVPTQTPMRNIDNPVQLKKLVSTLRRHASMPLLVTIDQEGGRVARLKERHGFPSTRSAQTLGNINNPDTTRYYASITAEMLKQAGIDANLAPVVDLNLNPENPVIGGIERSFSNNPKQVVSHAKAFVEAHQSRGILTTLKHFPGHGSSRDDSHLGMVDVSDIWHPDELIPYRKLIRSGHADMIMTAHIFNHSWDSDWPATLSPKVINGMLRNELGFNGVVVSDDMQMDAIRSYFGLETAIEQALLAGVDILSFANNSEYNPDIVPEAHRIIRKLIRKGRIPESRINDSYQRIRSLKLEHL